MSGCVGDPRGCNWIVVRTSGKLARDVQEHRHRLGSAVFSNNRYMKAIVCHCIRPPVFFHLLPTHNYLET
jgi:hypothetical protein